MTCEGCSGAATRVLNKKKAEGKFEPLGSIYQRMGPLAIAVNFFNI